MSNEPSTGSGDTEPTAETGEFEDFFEQGARGAYEEGPARMRQPLEPEIFEAPLVTPEQLARRARLQRGVGVLVATLGVAFLVLFARRGLEPATDVEPVPVAVKSVSTALGAARTDLVTPPVALAPPAVAEAHQTIAGEATMPEATVPEATAPEAAPVASKPAATAPVALAPQTMAPASAPLASPVALPRRVSGAQGLASSPAKESLRRLPASSGPPVRATSVPGRVVLAASPSRAVEPPPTASFPVDPR